MANEINYDELMQAAMRGLVRKIMEQVHDNGLPGGHHFFVSFLTTHTNVVIPEWLKERYPQDITVVIQNWYDNLEVTENEFSITLNFGDTPEHLTIPYDAILTFVDPSVEFGLQFQSDDEDMPSVALAVEDNDPIIDEDEIEVESLEPQQEAEIVSLDKFRK